MLMPISSEMEEGPEASSERINYLLIGSGRGIQKVLKEFESSSMKKRNNVLLIDPISQKEDQIKEFDFEKKTISLKNGRKISFQKCLIDLPPVPVLIPKKYYDDTLLQSDGKSPILELNNPTERRQAEALVRSGRHVTLVGGNSWEMIALASRLARIGRSVQNPRPVSIIFPSYGPYSSILPRQLSLLLLKRLSAVGVEVIPYSNLRYIGSNGAEGGSEDAYQVYIAKTYDSLNTSSLQTSAVILLPQPISSAYFREQESYNSPSLAPYRFLLDHPEIIETHSFAGGIMVNASLELMKDISIIGPLSNHAIALKSPSIHMTRYNCLHCPQYHQQMGRFIGQLWTRTFSDKSLSPETYKPRQIFQSLPFEWMLSSELSLAMLRIGHCSTHLESYSFTVKPSLAAASSGSTTKTTAPSRRKSSQSLHSFTITIYLQGEVIVGILINGRLNRAREDEEEGKEERASLQQQQEEDYSETEIAELEQIFYECIGKELPVTSSLALPSPPPPTSSSTSAVERDPTSQRLKQIFFLEQQCQTLLSHLLSSEVGRRKVCSRLELPLSQEEEHLTWLHRHHPASRMSYYDFQERVMKDYYQREGGLSSSAQEPIFHTVHRGGSKIDQLQAAYARGITQGRYQYDYAHQASESSPSSSSATATTPPSLSAQQHQPPLTLLK